MLKELDFWSDLCDDNGESQNFSVPSGAEWAVWECGAFEQIGANAAFLEKVDPGQVIFPEDFDGIVLRAVASTKDEAIKYGRELANLLGGDFSEYGGKHFELVAS